MRVFQAHGRPHSCNNSSSGLPPPRRGRPLGGASLSMALSGGGGHFLLWPPRGPGPGDAGRLVLMGSSAPGARRRAHLRWAPGPGGGPNNNARLVVGGPQPRGDPIKDMRLFPPKRHERHVGHCRCHPKKGTTTGPGLSALRPPMYITSKILKRPPAPPAKGRCGLRHLPGSGPSRGRRGPVRSPGRRHRSSYKYYDSSYSYYCSQLFFFCFLFFVILILISFLLCLC